MLAVDTRSGEALNSRPQNLKRHFIVWCENVHVSMHLAAAQECARLR